MAQSDYVVDNGSGAVVRADINTQLQSIATNNSGTAAPSITYPRMWWPDETNGRLKQRNAANTAWVDIGPLDVANMGHLVASNNLSDLASVSTARTNLGVYSTAQVDALVTSSLPRSYLAGLVLSNNVADSANDIDIASGACRDSANAADLALGGGITKRSDAAWVAGSGNGGMDTGTKPNNGTLHVWIIRKDADGSIDALFSTSATAPTMPAGYTAKRRLGGLRTDGSGNIRAFTQIGDEFYLNTPILDVNTTSLGTTPVNYTVSVPGGVAVEAIFNANVYSSGQAYVYVYIPGMTDSAASSTAAPLSSIGTNDAGTLVSGQIRCVTNTSAQVRANGYATVSSTVNFKLATIGWVDRRGRDD